MKFSFFPTGVDFLPGSPRGAPAMTGTRPTRRSRRRRRSARSARRRSTPTPRPQTPYPRVQPSSSTPRPDGGKCPLNLGSIGGCVSTIFSSVCEAGSMDRRGPSWGGGRVGGCPRAAPGAAGGAPAGGGLRGGAGEGQRRRGQRPGAGAHLLFEAGSNCKFQA